MKFSWSGVGGKFIGGAFAVALAMLFVLLLRSIAVQITPPPEPGELPHPDVSTPQLCDEAGGRWQNIPPPTEDRPAPTPSCEAYCQGPLDVDRDREVQEDASKQTSLFVFAIGGTLAVLAGLLLHTAQAVAPGLMLGGIFSFFVAGTQLWMLSPGLGRVITLAILFLILVGVGWYFFRESE